jgi:arginine repressor
MIQAMRSKRTRHSRIRELLQRSDIGTHERLAEALMLEGVEVSQSTLSKDLRSSAPVWCRRPPDSCNRLDRSLWIT